MDMDNEYPFILLGELALENLEACAEKKEKKKSCCCCKACKGWMKK